MFRLKHFIKALTVEMVKRKWRYYIWLIQDADSTAQAANLLKTAVAADVSRQMGTRFMASVLWRFAAKKRVLLTVANVPSSLVNSLRNILRTKSTATILPARELSSAGDGKKRNTEWSRPNKSPQPSKPRCWI